MAEREIKKLYRSIGEVGDLLELEPHVLRYWQTEFEELAPRKNRAGRRIYTDEDVAVIRRIKHLLRVEKYTIDGARRALAQENVTNGSTDRTELMKLRAFLEKLLDQL